ncbi:hypothetical protein V8E54_011932 [Elaphomyces granulatus]|jgi:tetratricopeptide (TPR) repeat protein
MRRGVSCYTLSSILEAKGDHVGTEELRRNLQETFEQNGYGIGGDINLAITLTRRGKHRQAEELLNRAFEKLERRHGKEKDFMLVRLKTCQAEVFLEQGRSEMAEKTYREALECDQRLLGSETETSWQLLTGIALSLYRQGKSQEAEKMFKEVAAICKRRFGEGDLVTKRTLQWLADAQFKNGKYDDSEETYRDVLLHARQRFGQDHLETLKVYSGLVAVLNARGKFQEAEATLESISKPIQNMALEPIDFKQRGVVSAKMCLIHSGVSNSCFPFDLCPRRWAEVTHFPIRLTVVGSGPVRRYLKEWEMQKAGTFQ